MGKESEYFQQIKSNSWVFPACINEVPLPEGLVEEAVVLGICRSTPTP